MKYSQTGVRTFLAALLSAALGHAHVTLRNPEGGEKLTGGANIIIEWEADNHDCVYNLYYSANGGTNWQIIILNLKMDVRTYKWTVPNEPTTKGVVRVIQDNVKPTDSDLEDKSGLFTIEPSTGLRGVQAAAGNVSMDFRSGNVEVTMELAQAADVTVQAFDARGKLAAILLEGPRGAGSHRLSFFSNRLQSAGPCLFKVSIGGQVHAFKATGGR